MDQSPKSEFVDFMNQIKIFLNNNTQENFTMGSFPSHEEDVDRAPPVKKIEKITDTEEVIRAMKWRLSRLEADNAMMNRTIANLEVANRELKVSISSLRATVAMNKPSGPPGEKKNLSVRLPKGSKSMYSK